MNDNKKRNYYCRVCGTNKGHNFGGCTNARGLREIIRIQDGYEETAREQANRIEELQKELHESKRVSATNDKVFDILLDLSLRFLFNGQKK